MGIYDRDYYRESSSRWFANFSGRSVTFWLVLINCIVFVCQILTAPQGGGVGLDLITHWGDFSFADIERGQLWRLMTSHFLHGGLWHIALNMLLLYWAGSELEGIYGPREFLAFYLTAALIISLGKVLLGLTGVELARSLGASGPVTAAFILFACHFPYRTILLFFILPVPVWLVAVGYVALDFLGFIGMGRTGIGYSAHLLGAAYGFAYYRFHWRITNWLGFVSGLLSRTRPRRSAGPRLYLEMDDPAELATKRSSPAARETADVENGRSVDEQLEAKLDHVLEKVSRYGRDSLSPDEHDLLLQASEIYKRRRSR